MQNAIPTFTKLLPHTFVPLKHSSGIFLQQKPFPIESSLTELFYLIFFTPSSF